MQAFFHRPPPVAASGDMLTVRDNTAEVEEEKRKILDGLPLLPSKSPKERNVMRLG